MNLEDIRSGLVFIQHTLLFEHQYLIRDVLVVLDEYSNCYYNSMKGQIFTGEKKNDLSQRLHYQLTVLQNALPEDAVIQAQDYINELRHFIKMQISERG